MEQRSREPTTTFHVLVADDEAGIREFVAEVLRDGGHLISTASNGRAALEYERSIQFDLIVLDLGLPDMSGIDVIRKIRAEARRPGLPILAITGDGSPASWIEAAEAGATDVLAKPFTVIEIESRVRALLKIGEFQRRADERIARIQQVEQLKTSLTQMIVHDQTSLLTALCGYLDMLGEGHLAAEQRETLQRTLAIARELRNMGGDVLDLDRLEENRMPVHHEPLDIASLVTGVVAEAKVLVRSTKRISVEMSPQVPVMWGDEEVIRRVIRNLITNALQHGSEGGNVWVSISLPSPEVLEVAVDDDGRGVPPA